MVWCQSPRLLPVRGAIQGGSSANSPGGIESLKEFRNFAPPPHGGFAFVTVALVAL